MATFENANGTDFEVCINTGVIKRVRDLADVDLLNLTEEYGLFTRLLCDPVTLVDILYVVCQRQCEVLGLSDEEFGEGLFGDVLDSATQAFMEALIGFFPNARQRENLEEIRRRANAVMDRAMDAVEARIASGELEAAAQEEVDRGLARLGRPSIGSPESVGSAPTL